MDGIWITPLDGAAPVGRRLAVKDLFDTAGVRTTYGSAVFADHVPVETAPAVRALEDAGWVDVGKANLHEFAYGTTSQNLHYGTVPNPRAPGRTAGGSSGGSAAALVAGLADAALGTDSGGSIRIPAACCGTVGFKPSYGRVSLEGVFPLAPSYDHVGPLGLDVATCADVMRVLDPGLDELELVLGDVSVAIAWTEHADPLVHARVEEAAALFPHARRLDFPEPQGTHVVFMREVGDVHRDLYPENADLYGENIRSKIERCIAVTEGEAARAAEARAEYEQQAHDALADVELLLTPTLTLVAPPADIDEVAHRETLIRLTYPFNTLGWPALALPCGAAEDGLPASIQIVGRKGADALVLAAAAALEAALKT